jgi:lipopolysaccharide biosynthesis protein
MKTLIIYATKDQAIHHERIDKFIKDGCFLSHDVTFVFVFNSTINNELRKLIPDYVICVERPDLGYDFGAWSDVILNKDIANYENYDAFIFLNSSVYGPCLPRYIDNKDWVKCFTNKLDHKTKLVGCTVNFDHQEHIQSYCWCVDKVFLKILIDENYFNNKTFVNDQYFYILNYEIKNVSILKKYGYDYFSFEYFRKKDKMTINSDISLNDYHKRLFGSNLQPFEIMFVKPECNIGNGNFNYVLAHDV